MTRDDKHTELPRCYDLRVITAHAWLYIYNIIYFNIYIYILSLLANRAGNDLKFQWFLASERYVTP